MSSKKDWWTSMGLISKIGVILISFAIVLWAAYMKTPKLEGFFQGSSPAAIGSVDCSKYTDCGSCASVGGCLWCPEASKCSNEDRSGFPIDSACNKATFVTFPDSCNRPSNPPFNPKIDSEPVIPTYSQGSNCPSTTDVVTDVMKTLDPTIKKVVSQELAAYGIPLVEGFQTRSQNIANMTLGSVMDEVRSITRRSIDARPAAPASSM